MVDDEIEEDLPPTPPPHPGIDHFVRENPTAAVVGALIIGIVIGRLGIL